MLSDLWSLQKLYVINYKTIEQCEKNSRNDGWVMEEKFSHGVASVSLYGVKLPLFFTLSNQHLKTHVYSTYSGINISEGLFN